MLRLEPYGEVATSLTTGTVEDVGRDERVPVPSSKHPLEDLSVEFLGRGFAEFEDALVGKNSFRGC